MTYGRHDDAGTSFKTRQKEFSLYMLLYIVCRKTLNWETQPMCPRAGLPQRAMQICPRNGWTGTLQHSTRISAKSCSWEGMNNTGWGEQYMTGWGATGNDLQVLSDNRSNPNQQHFLATRMANVILGCITRSKATRAGNSSSQHLLDHS